MVFVLVGTVVNSWMVALFSAPDTAMMSKFVRTFFPLMATLKMRCPTAVQ